METQTVDTSTDFQVLAACMRQDGAISRFAEEFDNKDVGYVHNQNGVHQLYNEMLDYYAATQMDVVDPVAFQSWLTTESTLYNVMGGPEGYKEFIDQIQKVEIPDINALVKLVKFRAKKQRNLEKIDKLKSEYTTSDHTDLNELWRMADDVKSSFVDISYDPMSKVRTTKDIIAGAASLWDMDSFLPTPYKNLNRALGYGDNGGFFRGGVHSIVALSGMGKSTLVKNLCNFWLDSGLSVLFINFEEPQPHWERIMMTQMTGVNIYAAIHEADSSQISKITKEFQRRIEPWGDRLMVRHDPDTFYFEDLEQWLREVMGASPVKPDIVVIDTIQSMFTKTGGGARWNSFEEIMVRSEKLAKEMDAAFIYTAQQNITSTKERRDVLNQSDMGGSVTITQKSTVAMFITPLKGSDDEHDAVSDRIMQLQIVKSRITGTTFSATPPLLIYEDDIKSYREYDPRAEDEKYTQPSVEVDIEDI